MGLEARIALWLISYPLRNSPFFRISVMHVYGRGGHSNQIAMLARGCNEKHENNIGKTSAFSLEYDNQKFLKEMILIWFSGKIRDCHSEVGVRFSWKNFFSLFNISSEIKCK